MTKKIKILGLNKPEDYLKKQVDIIKANKFRLLRDSDWTQLPDTPLNVENRLRWRIWRHKVRSLHVTVDNMDEASGVMDALERSKPPVDKGYSKFIFSQFDFSSDETFRDSCTQILKEILPDKKTLHKSFVDSAKLLDMESTFSLLIEIIQQWT